MIPVDRGSQMSVCTRIFWRACLNRLLRLIPRVVVLVVWGGVQEFAFKISSQVMLLVPGPGSENHWYREKGETLFQVWPCPDLGGAQSESEGLGREPGGRWDVPSDFPSTGPKPSLDHSEHKPGKILGKQEAGMPGIPTKQVSAMGRGKGAAWGLALLAKVQGGEEERGPSGWLLPAVFVGVSAPPWEAGILVSRTTSDAWGIEKQVFSGTKACK